MSYPLCSSFVGDDIRGVCNMDNVAISGNLDVENIETEGLVANTFLTVFNQFNMNGRLSMAGNIEFNQSPPSIYGISFGNQFLDFYSENALVLNFTGGATVSTTYGCVFTRVGKSVSIILAPIPSATPITSTSALTSNPIPEVYRPVGSNVLIPILMYYSVQGSDLSICMANITFGGVITISAFNGVFNSGSTVSFSRCVLNYNVVPFSF